MIQTTSVVNNRKAVTGYSSMQHASLLQELTCQVAMLPITSCQRAYLLVCLLLLRKPIIEIHPLLHG